MDVNCTCSPNHEGGGGRWVMDSVRGVRNNSLRYWVVSDLAFISSFAAALSLNQLIPKLSFPTARLQQPLHQAFAAEEWTKGWQQQHYRKLHVQVLLYTFAVCMCTALWVFATCMLQCFAC